MFLKKDGLKIKYFFHINQKFSRVFQWIGFSSKPNFNIPFCKTFCFLS